VSIVDPETSRICSEGTVGEIWVSGPTVAGGYWRRPDQSSETFNAFIADTNDGPFLRTGDLGFLADKELFVTGRLKDLIIISGANYYPQDIEAIVENAHPALRPGYGAAFSVEVAGQESLVIGHEIDRQFKNAGTAELENIAAAIRRAVYEGFDLDVYAVQLLRVGSIKRTASGKLRRQACRSDFLAGHSEALFESRLKRDLQDSSEEADGLSRSALLALSPGERGAALEERLRRRVARVLQMPWRQIDPSEPLGSYGLGSLKGTQLIASIEDSLGVTLPTTAVFNYPNVTELGRHLGRLMGFAVDAVVPHSEVIVQATHALEDEGLTEFLDAVERIPISDMQQMIADRRTRNQRKAVRNE
jgi:acyl carrier protein